MVDPLEKPSLIIFVGGLGSTPVEAMIAGAHREVTLDTIDRARETGYFRQIVVATDSEALANQVGQGVEVEMDKDVFHFGSRLREIIQKHNVRRPVYIGGGAAPLFSTAELANLAELVVQGENVVITNNVFSTDFAAFTPAAAIDRIELPALDNPLTQLLRHQAGLREIALPRSAATQFDVDTPSDLLALKIHPAAGPRTKAFLDTLQLDVSRVRAAMQFFVDPLAEVVVAGRVASYVWSHLETETACRVRVLSEERGMRADGREERGEVRSILGYYLEEVGLSRFFATVGQLGQAAFIDSRVIFNHRGLKLSAADRFLSDLGDSAGISDSFAREFTAAALDAPVPVVLGGHSLVSGGLWAIIDAAWLENDQQLEGQSAKGWS